MQDNQNESNPENEPTEIIEEMEGEHPFEVVVQKAEAPPAKKQKYSYIAGLLGHTLHRILYITNYAPFRQGKRALFSKKFHLTSR